MDISKAIQTVTNFKGTDLKDKISDLHKMLSNNTIQEIKFDYTQLLQSALIVKKVSAQIDEIIHAIGIISVLPEILEDNEKIIHLSLAAGSEGDGFDLITDKRVAEFKFSKWQGGSANAMRKRQVFKDLVKLMMHEGMETKELYVVDCEMIKHFLESSNAKWRKVLTSKALIEKFEDFLQKHDYTLETVSEIFHVSNVNVRNVEEVLMRLGVDYKNLI